MWRSEYRFYLLPWVMLAVCIALIPLLIESRRKKFDAFSPPVYAVWSHFAPAYIIGVLAIVYGWRPYFFSLVPNPDLTFPRTVGYICMGFAALFAGFYLPLGRRIGARIAAALPARTWQPQQVIVPALLLLACTGGLTYIAFSQGLAGYQVADEVGTFDAALLIATITLGGTATLLLWLVVFQAPTLTKTTMIALAVLIGWTLLEVLVSGRRGALYQAIRLAAGAFWLSGRRIHPRHAIVFGGAAAVAIFVGMVYGTTFRVVKGSEGQIPLSRYVPLAMRAAQISVERGLAGNVAYVSRNLSERLAEISATVAVVVGNYERLEPFEEEFGLKNNIVNSLAASVIPRFVWPEKPSVSDPRALGELYFRFVNSFAITPVGDLIRNFGPIGIPLGMGLLGFLFRVLYATLIEGQQATMWRTTAYLVLLTSVSFENFYSAILPTTLRTGLFLVVALLLVDLFTRIRLGPAAAAAPAATKQAT